MLSTTTFPLKDHVAHAFKTIYSVPYKSDEKATHDIARVIHGITHVIRAAKYIYPLINLYRAFGDKDAQALTPYDIFLIQIAVLYHDSARQGEGTDLWDEESAAQLYDYLTKALSVPHKKAVLLADAVAKKDAKGEKTIFQKLVHDADCLDIIRARSLYDASYLDFYKQIASENPHAFDLMAKIIAEARSLIDQCGDSYGDRDFARKNRFETANADSAMVELFKKNPAYLLSKLQDRLLTNEELEKIVLDQMHDAKPMPVIKEGDELTDELLAKKMRQGKVFLRSITSPSALRKKLKNTTDAKAEEKADETAAQVEIRKLLRRKGVATRTKKPDNLTKQGNPKRSTSMIGWGASVFAEAGFLIIDPDLAEISLVKAHDCRTGQNKKHDLEYTILPDTTETQAMLDALLKKQKMGGSLWDFGNSEATHNEILYNITHYDAVYFTQDCNFHDADLHSSAKNKKRAKHPSAPILQAIYLKNEYQIMAKKALPIFEYSGTHDFIKKRSYTDEEIIKLWEDMCRSYLQSELDRDHYHVLSLTVDQIKINSMYYDNVYSQKKCPADINYAPLLRERINKRIIAMRDELSNERELDLKHKLLAGQSIFSPEIIRGVLHFTSLCEHPLLKPKIIFEIQLKSIDIDSFDNLLPYFESLDECLELLADKDQYLQNPSRLDDFYQQKVNQLYALAKKLQLNDKVMYIQKMARAAIFARIKKNPILDASALKKLILIACLFDCYPDVNDLIMSQIEKTMAEKNRELGIGGWQSHAIFCQQIIKCNLVNDNIRALLKTFVNQFGLAIKNNKANRLNWYLIVARLQGTPLDEVRSVVLAFLKNAVFITVANNWYFMEHICHAELLMDEAIFSELISKVRYQTYLSTVSDIVDAFNEYVGEIDMIVAGQVLCSKQKELIKVAQRNLLDLYLVNLEKFYSYSGPFARIRDISDVLTIAGWLDYSASQTKEMLFKLLNKKVAGFYAFDQSCVKFLGAFKKYSLLRDDPEIFSLVIAKIMSNKYNEFFKQVALLKLAMPGHALNAMQSAALEKLECERFRDSIYYLPTLFAEKQRRKRKIDDVSEQYAELSSCKNSSM